MRVPELEHDVQMRFAFALALIAAVAALATAQPVSADTCCANVPVQPAPRSVDPGDVVALTGLQCLRSDGSGPLSLNLVSFWLATGRRPAEDPGDTPGNLPYPGPARRRDVVPVRECPRLRDGRERGSHDRRAGLGRRPLPAVVAVRQRRRPRQRYPLLDGPKADHWNPAGYRDPAGGVLRRSTAAGLATVAHPRTRHRGTGRWPVVAGTRTRPVRASALIRTAPRPRETAAVRLREWV